jgi:uncharacterized phiE125 gp8 family phage protein
VGPGPFTPDPLGSVWPIPFPWLSFGFSGPVPGFSLVTTTPPAVEPVDSTLAKKQCRIDYADEDTLFAVWIPAARKLVEAEAATALVNQTLLMQLPSWPLDGQVRLPVGPVSAVGFVKYYDAGGTLQTLAAGTDYQTWLDYRPPLVLPAPQKYWPVVQFARVPAVQVQFVAGYGPDATAVPETAKQAILMTIAYWAANRGDEEAPGKFGLSEGAVRLIERHLSTKGYR